jgi:hypothetical protein
MQTNYTTPTHIRSGELLADTEAPVSWKITLDGKPFQKNNSFGSVGFGI